MYGIYNFITREYKERIGKSICRIITYKEFKKGIFERSRLFFLFSYLLVIFCIHYKFILKVNLLLNWLGVVVLGGNCSLYSKEAKVWRESGRL